MPVIRPGFANVQVLGLAPNGNQWLSACGAEAVDWDPEEGLFTIFDTLAEDPYPDDVMASDWVINSVRVQIGTSDPSAPLVYEQTGNFTGNNGNALAPNTSFLVVKRTLLGGRAGRGRNYLPGVQEAAVDNAGNITGDLATAGAAVSEFFPRLITALSLTVPCILHSDDSRDPTPVTSWTLAPTVATQRRRLRS